MAYAVIHEGGTQYRVQEGDVIDINRLDAEAGDTIEFSNVLLYTDGDKVEVGKPHLENVSVKGIIEDSVRGPKVTIIKMHRRKHYRRKQGHRQELSVVRITEVAVK